MDFRTIARDPRHRRLFEKLFLLAAHRSNNAKSTNTDVLGIYELDDDTLKVACVVWQRKDKQWAGKPRPKGIDPNGADVVIQYKRMKLGK